LIAKDATIPMQQSNVVDDMAFFNTDMVVPPSQNREGLAYVAKKRR